MNPSSSGSFESLLQTHRGILYQIARAYAAGTSPDDVDDLAQEIALQLWRSFDRYDPQRRFSTWMYRIALNVAISYRRKTRRNDASPIEAYEPFLASPSCHPNPEVEELYRRIRMLHPLDRSLILLYLEGNTMAEIGEILGISATNASTRLSRLKQQLKQGEEASQ